ncbi:MAG: flagellar protein FlbB [Spirochaetaceae bacterium]|nr:flagellar protein FlbB [Spirochaetaceae bacterium]
MAGRIIILLILILILAGGGILWFDYLNVIDAKTTLAPLYKFIGKEGRTGEELGPDDFLNLDAERLAMRLEAEALRELDMDKREDEITSKIAELEQMAQELEERQKALDEMENSINDMLLSAENKERNVEGISQWLTNMQPERAVAIITAMNDQNAIDVLRKTDEVAQRDGTGSLVPYWLQLMAATPEGAARAAELQRKMVASSP